MIKVDATGQNCHIPATMTKNILEKLEEGKVEISVDNKVALEKLQKMSRELGYDYTIAETGDIFKIVINKIKEDLEEFDEKENIVIVIDSTFIGKSENLGKILLKEYIHTLSKMDNLPRTIIFYNEGVKLALETSEILSDLKCLEACGVEIVLCETSLNFYNIKNQIKVGTPANIYTIIERQLKAKKIIKL